MTTINRFGEVAASPNSKFQADGGIDPNPRPAKKAKP